MLSAMAVQLPLQFLLLVLCEKSAHGKQRVSAARNHSGHFAHARFGPRVEVGEQTVPAQSQASSESSVSSGDLSLVVAQVTLPHFGGHPNRVP